MDYNPNSFDAQFAKVLQMLENQNEQHTKKWEEDKKSFEEIMRKQDMTNGRVLGLEKREQYMKGKVAGIAIACSAGITILGFVIKALLS